MTTLARTWDWLPRIAALVACGLMAWSVVPVRSARGATPDQRQAAAPTEEPVAVLERVDLQTAADTPHLGLLFTFSVSATAPGRITAAVDARILDRAGTMLWTGVEHLSVTASGGSGAAWMTVPRALPADRYHSATAALRDARFRPADP